VILVIGGRSKIGSALIEALVADKQEVRALAREGEPVGALAGVEVVAGDLVGRHPLIRR
jgi:uncharacterized protein YbjT (DUF2867 family)